MVPPGVSAANQYTETLPGPGGDSPADERHSGKNGGAFGRRDETRLEALGADGRAAARLAAETWPASVAGGQDPAGTRAGASKSGSAVSRASGFDQVLAQVTGTGAPGTSGIGLLLPLLIAAALVTAAGYAFNRRRPARRRD